ncbi:hypothetical protein ACFRMN_35070 [Streptomyces sp. NPDC056835]|uniref:hypothetical protein n=1 Tax=Streptomyces sp. NPDC056835 TaxID=3345956 RepID=UPI0036BB9872
MKPSSLRRTPDASSRMVCCPLSGYKEGGMDAKAYDVTGIDTRIRYDSNRTPPFTVMTSMPYKP